MVRMEHLLLRSPTRSDVAIMTASASDAAAQQWLGWREHELTSDSRRESLLGRQPGQGRVQATKATAPWHLIAIDRATGLVAGGVGGNPAIGDVGGWLAPRFRGRHLGAELFAGAAQFVHYHLGEAHVLAGTEPANTAAVHALLSAGYTPTDGPGRHQLPDGRVVPSRWFGHTAARPTRCG